MPNAQTRHLAAALHSVAIRLLRKARVADRSAGVGPTQLSVLSVLAFHEGLALGELAHVEQVSHPTMSRVVASLQAIGAVRKRPDAADRRSQRIEITARGRAIFDAARVRRLRIIGDIVADLKPAVRKTLDEALGELAMLIERL